MPSIPQSLLWISLVVLWLFVLVPMLISKRDTVRRTSDVALATRVLNTGRRARLLRRTGPATGHYSDPDWRPSEDEHEDDLDEDDEDEHQRARPQRTVVLAAAVEVPTESDYLDVDIVEMDSGALPVGASAAPQLPLDFGGEGVQAVDDPVDDVREPTDVPEPTEAIRTFAEADFDEDLEDGVDEEFEPEAEANDELEPDGTDHDYEYVDDSSGLEAPSDTDLHIADSITAARRNRYESKAAAAARERKYKFRKRMLVVMAVLLVGSAPAAFLVAPVFWWACGSLSAVTVLYLGYLRRQTRIEEQVRRRRAQRMMRSRLGVENTTDGEFDVVPSRLRRPGAVVLEIDDEDPIFEHLDYAPYAADYPLQRASGQ
jgi:uncharacterized membrane protein